jgi:hypothetical protein
VSRRIGDERKLREVAHLRASNGQSFLRTEHSEDCENRSSRKRDHGRGKEQGEDEIADPAEIEPQ